MNSLINKSIYYWNWFLLYALTHQPTHSLKLNYVKPIGNGHYGGKEGLKKYTGIDLK